MKKYFFIGPLVHWTIGPLVHWSIGPLGVCMHKISTDSSASTFAASIICTDVLIFGLSSQHLPSLLVCETVKVFDPRHVHVL